MTKQFLKENDMKLRPATEEDLKDFRYDLDEKCVVCDLDDKITIGSYRGSDFYMCKECFLKGVMFEEEE